MIQPKFITAEVHQRILVPHLFQEIARVTFSDGQFEEIPLIERYGSVEFLKQYFAESELSLYLASLAQHLLFDSDAYFRKSLPEAVYNTLFSCLTFVDFTEEMEDVGFCVPHLFFSTLPTVRYLANAEPLTMTCDHAFCRLYAPIIDRHDVQVYKTTTQQQGAPLERIYLVFSGGVPHAVMNK